MPARAAVLAAAWLVLTGLPAAVAGTGTVRVATADQFITAVQDRAISVIELEGEVIIGEASGLDGLPLRIDNRNLTIAGPVVQDLIAFPYGSQPGVPCLDFSQRWPVLLAGPNSSLTLRDLRIEGAAAFDQPAVVQSGYPNPGGLNTFPSIVVENTAQVHIERNAELVIAPRCTPEHFADRFASLKWLLGNDVQLLPNNTYTVLGNLTLPLGMKSGTGQDLGSATLYIVGPTGYTCVTHATSRSTGGSGRLSGGAWAGIGVGIAVGVVALAALAAFLVKRRRACRRPAAASGAVLQLRDGGEASKASNGGKLAEAGAVASIEAIQRQQLEAGFSGMLRVRFGGLEGLEIGGLIGRGAYGRVYRGSLRGAAVAVKVMEHSVGPTGNTSAPGSDPAAEALLLTSLAHPNIVTVYKAATLRVPAACSTPSGCSDSWASPRLLSGAGAAGEAQALAPGGPSSSSKGPASGADAPAESNSVPAINLAALVAGQAAVAASSSGSARASDGTRHHSHSAGGGSGGTNAAASALLAGSGAGILPTVLSGQFETWLVMEYVDRGSLEDAIRKKVLRRADGGRREALLYGILVDVAEGMCFLHEANVVHGDLKPGNILLKSGGGQGQLVVKIADFGLSKLLPGDQHTLVRTHTLGTVAYMPPELLSAGRLSRATDVYSFGIIMLEAWLCGPSYSGRSEAAVFYAVVHQQERPSLPDDMPAGYAALIQACWQHQASERPAFTEVLTRLRQLQAEGKAAAGQGPQLHDNRAVFCTAVL